MTKFIHKYTLDSHNERQIGDVLTNLRGNHTVLVVAHRLSTIMDADLIHHITFAASNAEPPPTATIQSGPKAFIFLPPSRTVLTDGFGSTPSIMIDSIPAFLSSFTALSRKPNFFMELPGNDSGLFAF